MFKRLLFLLIAFSGIVPVLAQHDTANLSSVKGKFNSDTTTLPQGGNDSHLRISLLTCGRGDEEVWEVFGHTALRVIDSIHHTDLVYNYGMFDYGPGFELQFMRGKLLYCVGVEEFNGFLPQYVIINTTSFLIIVQHRYGIFLRGRQYLEKPCTSGRLYHQTSPSPSVILSTSIFTAITGRGWA
jgi:hypothetical protein